MRSAKGTVSLFLVMLLAGCRGATASRLPDSPQEVIQQVHAACVAGEYEKTLPLFRNGQETWEVSPSTAKAIIDKVCRNQMGQTADYIEIGNGEVRGDGAFYQTTSYATPGHSDWGRTLRWEFIKVKEGWLVVSL